MSTDPRYRGPCPVNDAGSTGFIDPDTGNMLISNYYKGQKVKHCGIENIVHNLDHYFAGPACINLASARIVVVCRFL